MAAPDPVPHDVLSSGLHLREDRGAAGSILHKAMHSCLWKVWICLFLYSFLVSLALWFCLIFNSITAKMSIRFFILLKVIWILNTKKVQVPHV
jgi:hypothetical protein